MQVEGVAHGYILAARGIRCQGKEILGPFLLFDITYGAYL